MLTAMVDTVMASVVSSGKISATEHTCQGQIQQLKKGGSSRIFFPTPPPPPGPDLPMLRKRREYACYHARIFVHEEMPPGWQLPFSPAVHMCSEGLCDWSWYL